MRLVQIVVSREGFREVTHNVLRLVLLDLLIRLALRSSAQLLLLPAGFLAARNWDELLALVAEVERRALTAGLAVIGGVDAEWVANKRARTFDDAVRTGRLPFFGFAVGAVVRPEARSHPWRQTSIDNQNAELVPDERIPRSERLVVVRGIRVAVLVCGELFNWRTRAAVSELRPQLVVDVGHDGMGQGLIPSMRRVARDGGCAVGHAQHLGSAAGGLHFVDAQGTQHSVPATANPLERSGPLWAGWTVRDL